MSETFVKISSGSDDEFVRTGRKCCKISNANGSGAENTTPLHRSRQMSCQSNKQVALVGENLKSL